MFAQRALVLSVAISVLTGAFADSVHAKSTKSAKSHSAGKDASDETAVRARIAELTQYVSKGDAKAVAGIWAADGSFTDDEGNSYKGRAAVEKNFSAAFEEDKPQIEMTVGEIKFLSGNVALAEGTVRRLDGDAQPFGRYSLVFSKQEGQWFLSSATETMIVDTEEPNPLADLGWLIGDWKAEKNGGSAVLNAQWLPGENFLVCRYDITKAGKDPEREFQLIGWDPNRQIPISWTFQSSGAYGHANWNRNDKEWRATSTNIERDGSTTTATNVITQIDSNTFTWQSVNRTIDGVPAQDTLPITVQRVLKTGNAR